MNKISVKLALFFILLICISAFLSFLASALFTYNIRNEMEQNQRSIANSLLELDEKTDLSLKEIVYITSTSMYDVSKIDDISSIEINQKDLEKIEKGEIVFIYHGILQGTATFLKTNNSYIKIGLRPGNNIFTIVGSRIWFTLISFIIIGAILIALSGKRAVKPILQLTLATKEVAKGNFDIQVENNSDDEIGQLTQHFNRMTRELKNIEYLRKDFISNISHEFKTPIASIQGFAKLLQKGNISHENKKEYINVIVDETTRLSNLSSNLLKLSKLENQEILGERTVFSLDEQIRKSILLLEHQWNRKNIEFHIELDKVQYLGDEELLQHIWINLIGNAIKFSYMNSSIEVKLKRMDSTIIVKVRDYGVGISDENMEYIFEKFYQGEKCHSYEGSGLGLPLVKRIVDIYGGSIYVESKLGKGSTFIVELPIEE
ncbi:HAMP domain-containing sensor histidine kinase [Schnuerera sp.]|uniref:HAMP domain-containing sensor histidine kinase n=1 Tax=Schnuerera sp. TaxID=2794844 RepID=UPI002C6881EC|nr:HAMP domain-containing sensor histidine kinase [Schnuerera sp.]HSH34653.1 HAMP domain-containing sensor histidine kinase [Schnuerera sp.]